MSQFESPVTLFKLALLHRGKRPCTTNHRFRGRFTYEQVLDVLSHLCGGSRRLAIAYTDDEGDEIVVSSAMEWAECLRLHHGDDGVSVNRLPLKLRVKQVRLRSRLDGGSASEVSESDTASKSDGENSIRYTEASISTSRITTFRDALSSVGGDANTHEDPVDLSAMSRKSLPTGLSAVSDPAVPIVGAVPRLHLSAVSRRVAAEGTPAAVCPTSTISANSDAQCSTDDLLHLLSIVFKCDAAAMLLEKVDMGPMGMIVRRSFCEQEGVSAVIDMHKLEELCVVQSATLIASTAAEETTRFLETAVAVFPTNTTLLYDYACSQAGMNKPEAALDALIVALQRGFTDLDALMADEHLEQVRNLPSFKNSLKEFFPASFMEEVANPEVATVASLEPVNVTSIPPPAAQTIAVPPSSLGEQPTPRTAYMRTVFPELTNTAIQEVLHRAHGEVIRAVNLVLDTTA